MNASFLDVPCGIPNIEIQRYETCLRLSHMVYFECEFLQQQYSEFLQLVNSDSDSKETFITILKLGS